MPIKPTRQGGWIMLTVLFAVAGVAVLSVAALQAFSGAGRISGQAADRRLAESMAETALQEGRARVLSEAWTAADFAAAADEYCSDGLCAFGNPLAERKCGKEKIPCLIAKGKPSALAVTKKLSGKDAPRHVIEYLGESGGKGRFRITAWARGRSAQTQAVRQDYAAVERGGDGAR